MASPANMIGAGSLNAAGVALIQWPLSGYIPVQVSASVPLPWSVAETLCHLVARGLRSHGICERSASTVFRQATSVERAKLARFEEGIGLKPFAGSS